MIIYSVWEGTGK